MMRFYNKDKNKERLSTLSSALANKNKTTINVGGINQPVQQKQVQDDNTWQGAGQLLKGGVNLYNGIKDFKGNNNSGTGLFSSSINDYVNGVETPSSPISSAINSNVTGSGEIGGSTLTNAIGTEAGGSATGGFGSSVPWAAIAKGAKMGYNGIFNKTDENGYDDYSDLEQSVAYPLQGAATGSMFGPWGALGGALYGLGYSFKDDMGLDDNNWLTTLLFPIGMGDEHQGIISV